MKINILLLIICVVNINFAQTTLPVGKLTITNDGTYNSSINSGNSSRIDMGFDGEKGFIKFGAHTGSGQREDILYMRGSDGNVGIGTTNPFYKLDVKGTIYSDKLYVGKLDVSNDGTYNSSINSGNSSRIDMGFDGEKGFIKFGAHTGSGQREDILYMRGSDGNVGIGTINPFYKLDVKGTIYSDKLYVGKLDVSNDGVYNTSINSGSVARIDMGFDGAKGFIKFGAHTGGGQRENILYMRGSDGNVGIGTEAPDSKLAVNGTIHSKEVKVDMVGWSDFVFKKQYSLPTLEDVEKHIAEKGHLENIPSEEEVLKNGINLGEMNAKLLQKMEEMTLYMIEQNKRMNKIEKENQDLKTKIDSITK